MLLVFFARVDWTSGPTSSVVAFLPLYRPLGLLEPYWLESVCFKSCLWWPTFYTDLTKRPPHKKKHTVIFADQTSAVKLYNAINAVFYSERCLMRLVPGGDFFFACTKTFSYCAKSSKDTSINVVWWLLRFQIADQWIVRVQKQTPQKHLTSTPTSLILLRLLAGKEKRLQDGARLQQGLRSRRGKMICDITSPRWWKCVCDRGGGWCNTTRLAASGLFPPRPPNQVD